MTKGLSLDNIFTLEGCPNVATFDEMWKCRRYLGSHRKVCVSVSGGADSDIMLDLIWRVMKADRCECEIQYVWFNTGIETEATKRHLCELEERYGIEIKRIRVKTPVPAGCKIYGQPFISKFVSQMIERLQKKGFDFKNDGRKGYEELCTKYPKAKGALMWWCNEYKSKIGRQSHFNISAIKWLKEFMIENPPEFKISDKCCEGAKKKPFKDLEKDELFDMECLGLRKAEGGIRATGIHSCYTETGLKSKKGMSYKAEPDIYRPLWWFTDKDKAEYKEWAGIKYSDLYEVWGFSRSGCANCPYNSKYKEEREIIGKYEPRLVAFTDNVFRDSYAYRKAFEDFKEVKRNEKRIV